MAKIAAASLKLRAEEEPSQAKPLKRFKNATDKRLYRLEGKVDRLLEHFGLV